MFNNLCKMQFINTYLISTLLVKVAAVLCNEFMCICSINKWTILFHKIPRTLVVYIKRLTDWQRKVLMEQLQASEYLTKEKICQLTESLNIQEKTLHNWFRNMRQQVKAKEGICKSEPFSVDV